MSQSKCFKRRHVIAAAILSVSAGASLAMAQTSFTTVTSGDWANGETWAVGGTTFPSGAAGDSATLTGNAVVTITGAQSAMRMTVGPSTGSIGTFTVAATGSLLIGGGSGTSRLIIGSSSTNTSVGTVLTGGSISCDTTATSGGITLGLNDNSRGELNVGGTITYNPNATTSTGPRIGEKGTGTLNINTGANVNFASSTAVLVELALSQGSTGVVNVNDGLLTVNAFRTSNAANGAITTAASGTVNITGGTLNVLTTTTSTGVFSNAAGGAVRLNLSGGTLAAKVNLSATTTPLTAFNWSGGTLQMSPAANITNSTPMNLASGGTGAIFEGLSGTTTWSGAISGAGSLTLKSGILTVTSASNTMTGGITVKNGGILQGTNAAFGSPGTTNVLTLETGARLAGNSTGTGSSIFPNSVALTGDVGIGREATSTSRVVLTGPINLGGNTRTVTLINAGTGGRALDLAGSVNNGTLVLTSAQGGADSRVRLIAGLLFNNANLTLRNVTVNLSANAGLNMTGALFLDTGGILDMGDNTTGASSVRSPVVGSLAGTGNVMNRPLAAITNAQTAVLSVIGTSTTTYSGVISDSTTPGINSALTLGGGDLTLTTAQPYTGPTTVNGGVLRLGAGATLASNAFVVGTAGTLNAATAYPAGLPLSAAQTLTYNGTVVGKVINNGLVQYNANTAGTVSSDISGTGLIAKTNPLTGIASTIAATGSFGTATFTGSLTGFTGNVLVDSGLAVFNQAVRPAGTSSLSVTSGLAGTALSGTVTTTGSAILAAATSPSTVAVAGEFGSVTVGAGSTLTVAASDRTAGQQRVLVTSALSVAGTLDLTNNDLIVKGGNFTAISNAVAAWYNNGNFGGASTIVSSSAGGSGDNALATLAVVDNSVLGRSTFDGFNVGATDVLVKYTFLGDTNLDGTVDTTDLARLMVGIRNPGLLGWANGDTNYDGKINGLDYANLVTSLRLKSGTFGDGEDTGGVTGTGAGVIPEPSALGLLLLAAPLAGRRRR